MMNETTTCVQRGIFHWYILQESENGVSRYRCARCKKRVTAKAGEEPASTFDGSEFSESEWRAEIGKRIAEDRDVDVFVHPGFTRRFRDFRDDKSKRLAACEQ